MSTLTRSPGGRRTRGGDLVDELTRRDGVLRAALESVHANLFVADLDLTLVWMNRRALATMTSLAPGIREAFGLDLGSVLGGSIHRFHADPARIERILSDPSALPREATFTFGGVTLRTMINAITDEAGERFGYVVQWDNVSERNQAADVAVREVVEATGGIAHSIDESAASADRNAANAQTAAAATEELRAAVAEISRSTTASADLVRRAVAATKDGVEKLRDLESAGREIGEFLRLITGLAEQTKMLALNANIEAARAGDAGRGFAVVADEVKNLAGTTAASVTDIESRIRAIQGSTTAGFDALAEIEQLVDRIDESHATVAAAIEEQTSVTAEIARAVAEIADSARTNTEVLARVTTAVTGVSGRAQALHSLIVGG